MTKQGYAAISGFAGRWDQTLPTPAGSTFVNNFAVRNGDLVLPKSIHRKARKKTLEWKTVGNFWRPTSRSKVLRHCTLRLTTWLALYTLVPPSLIWPKKNHYHHHHHHHHHHHYHHHQHITVSITIITISYGRPKDFPSESHLELCVLKISVWFTRTAPGRDRQVWEAQLKGLSVLRLAPQEGDHLDLLSQKSL